MTISKHLHRPPSRSSSKTRLHPFRAPEEEEDIAHIHVSLRFALLVFGIVPFCTYSIALWVAAHPHVTEIDMNPNYTKYVKETFQFNETGNGEIWVYNDDGTKQNLGLSWNRFYVFNMSHYTFGFGNYSFCNKRNETYEHDWSTSIFRATQLYSSVQTGMRYGLLFVMQRTLTSAFIGAAYVLNEVLVYLAYFLLSALHVVFDKKYLPYDTICFSMALMLSMSKLMLRNFTESLGMPTLFRCIGVMVLITAHAPLKEDIQDYADNIYCDTFAPPKVCVLQLLCLFILFFNNLYDVQQSRIFQIVVSATAEDVAVQNIPTKTVFRRQKPLPTCL
ncbi:unnamed protein product [Caenorhabditis sp. 36 PRJEB53466]|nr:unnamed protein product [Caenorhabditis sp. 36 PRJEB53466]